MEGFIDLVELLSMRDELINLQPSLLPILHQTRQLRSPLDTPKRTTPPNPPRHQLERPRRDLRSRRRHANNNRLAPTLMTRLQRGPHDLHIPRTIKRIITPAIRHLNQLLLNRLLPQFGRIDKMRAPELRAPLLLLIIHIHYNNFARFVLHGPLYHTQPHTPRAEHGYIGPLFDFRGDDGCAVASGNAAAEETRAVHGRGLVDGDDGDVGDDGVLGEGGGAHEVEEVLAFAFEARGAVRHDAFALGGADLAAEVGLAGLAEFAFFAFGCAGWEVLVGVDGWCRGGRGGEGRGGD